KAKAWLQEHDIPYTERNIFSEHLTLDEIKSILKMTEDGTDEIISTRSKTYQKLNVDIDALPLQELYTIIQDKQGLVRRQIIIYKTYQKLNVDIDALTLQELYTIIQDNPGLLRRPIILDDKRLQVGYNEDEIRRFLPRKVRTFQLLEAQRMVD